MLVGAQIGKNFDPGDNPVMKEFGNMQSVLQETVDSEPGQAVIFSRFDMDIRSSGLVSGVNQQVNYFGYRRVFEQSFGTPDLFFEEAVDCFLQIFFISSKDGDDIQSRGVMGNYLGPGLFGQKPENFFLGRIISGYLETGRGAGKG